MYKKFFLYFCLLIIFLISRNSYGNYWIGFTSNNQAGSDELILNVQIEADTLYGADFVLLFANNLKFITAKNPNCDIFTGLKTLMAPNLSTVDKNFSQLRIARTLWYAVDKIKEVKNVKGNIINLHFKILDTQKYIPNILKINECKFISINSLMGKNKISATAIETNEFTSILTGGGGTSITMNPQMNELQPIIIELPGFETSIIMNINENNTITSELFIPQNYNDEQAVIITPVIVSETEEETPTNTHTPSNDSSQETNTIPENPTSDPSSGGGGCFIVKVHL